MEPRKQFTQDQVDAIASVLGHASDGLTHSEIGHLCIAARLTDGGAVTNKVIRVQSAFAHSQNERGDRTHILAFIRHAMKPARYLGNKGRYDGLRQELNEALAFAGLFCDDSGQLISVTAATTISEAESRARELRGDLVKRDVHADVLHFCKAELLVDNYFHATQEAVKSIAHKIRARTGLDDDGGVLCDRAFGGDTPMLAINQMTTKSERDEQKGFCNLLKGVFGMFRNPTAHEARIKWAIDKQDAEDLLSLLSLLHRRVDRARMPARV